MKDSLGLLGVLALVGCAVGLVGCGTYNALSPAAASVVATTTRPAGKCEVLGTLTGKGGGASGGYVSNEDLIEYALNDLRNQAIKMGATHVVYSSPGLGGIQGTTNSAMVMGEAMRCEGSGGAEAAAASSSPAPTASSPATATPPTVAPAAATGGCQFDTQCKGDRICVDGGCVFDKAPAPASSGQAPAAP